MGRAAGGNKGITLKKGDYVIGAVVTPSQERRNRQRRELAARAGLTSQVEAVIEEVTEATAAQPLELTEPGETVSLELSEESAEKLAKLDAKLGLTPCLILSVSENGYGKRTDVDRYRLQSRGGKGVINMKTSTKTGKVTSIQLVDDTTEMMVISQQGKIIRIDTKSVRAAGRSAGGVKLLDLDSDDKVAAAMTIPPEDPETLAKRGNGEGGLPIQ